jgi:hypothetical protein
MVKLAEIGMQSKINEVESLPDATMLEQILRTIVGVQGVRVLMNSKSIKEVHVLASSQRSSKKIVRDIETLLMVRYAYRIDFRCISITQLPQTDPAVEQISLMRVGQVRKPDGIFIEVDLLKGVQRYRGSCILQDDLAQASALAAVDAINALFLPAAPFELGNIQCTILGARRTVIAHLIYQTTEDLLGTAFVQGCIAESAVRAVLEAANCRLEGMVGEKRWDRLRN